MVWLLTCWDGRGQGLVYTLYFVYRTSIEWYKGSIGSAYFKTLTMISFPEEELTERGNKSCWQNRKPKLKSSITFELREPCVVYS
jgi:hypothetical protein